MTFEHRYLQAHGVTLFLDIGANAGQTGRALRKAGYDGRILSFEPIAECYARLADAAKNDPLWETRHIALGAQDGSTQIGVSENLVSSSIRAATPELIAIYEPIRYTRHEEIPLARLDNLYDIIVRPEDVVYLKIDTQGFERDVIAGAQTVLPRINAVRMEVSVGEVYEGEMTIPEAITLMEGHGFTLIEIWPAWRHPESHEVLQFDLMFRRRDQKAVPV